EKTEPADFSNTSQKYIPKDFYNNVTLDKNIPDTFYKNEVYTITGETDVNSYEKITVLLDPDDDNDLNYDTFTTEISNGNFEISIYFKESGNFNLGILPGNSGETIIAKISVLPSIPNNNSDPNDTPEKARSLNAEFKNDKTFINFSVTPLTLKKLTFKQNENSITYISRQNTDSITVKYKDFQNFQEGKVSYFIETAKIDSLNPLKISSDFTKSDINEINSTKHTFSYINDQEISASPPEIIKNIQPFTFSGTVKTDTKIKSYLIKPDGSVKKVNLSTQTQTTTYLNEEIIPENGNFKFEYDPSSEGTYIIEILNKHSLPILNHPVYIGKSIPLIPDFFDLNKREFFFGNFDVDSLRTQLLKEINETRKQYGLPEIVMSMELNNLAQSHSEDMAENIFFGHINLQNQSPEDRRLAEGIKTYIGENIAQDVSIPFAHNGLMRSAVHRKNILEEDWTRVGLGIALSEGYLFITEEFSGSEITENDLENYKDELFSDINSKRIEYDNPKLIYDYILESAGNQLNEYTIEEKKELTNSIFQETIESYNITGTSQAIGRVFNIWSDIHSSILNEEESIFKDEWEKIGIDIQTDQTGTIYTFLIINNP
ncbi:hypothetical protein GF366_02685, partial [Candidatus Peregrinibacteria bacterium]|nr:hypothetical protein [Candidatus Peregrinibacteria bacterium]